MFARCCSGRPHPRSARRKNGPKIMRRFVPSVRELMVFGFLALLFSLIVQQIQPHVADLGAAGLACPMFLVAAVLGLRKSPLWTMQAQAEAEVEDVDSGTGDPPVA